MKKKTTMSLCLDDVDDDGDNEAQPRRFVRLPSGHLLAYGGMNGNISCLVDRMDNNNNNNNKFVIVQRYDDEVRAVAVSPNGKRIAIGFDDGSTQIYKFDEYDVTSSESHLHPFVKAIDKVGKKKNNDDYDDDDGLLSQDFLAGHTKMDYFAGPRFESPIRDLQFIRLLQEDAYLLAIASEGGLCLVAVTTPEEMVESPRHLEQEVRDHHDHGGIRGIAINDSADVMATLGMDGRLCLWDLNQIDLLVREDNVCIPKKDVGEILGADPYDRSCRPLIRDDNVIVTPGKLIPFVRVLDKDAGSIVASGGKDGNDPKSVLHVVDDTRFEGATDNGHMEPIVTMTYFSNNQWLATSGRDAQIILWRSVEDDDTSSIPPNALSTKWKIVGKHRLKSPATDLFYHKDKIYAACVDGTCAVVDVSRSNDKKSTNEESITSKGITSLSDQTLKGPKAKSIKSKAASKRAVTQSNIDEDDDDDDDDDDVDFSNNDGTANVSTEKASNRVRFVADEAAESDIDDKPFAGTNNHSKTDIPGASRGEEDDDDNVGGYDDDDDSLEHDLTPQFLPTMNSMIPLVTPQPAFSPSSTPLDLSRRYLCWNHIGSVTVMRGDDQRNTIDINFTDSAFKRPISFTDNINFIVGSVGEEGGIFASDLQDDDDDDDENDRDDFEGLNMSEEIKRAIRRDRKKNPKAKDSGKPMGSSIFFYRFETFGPLRNKDWYLTLPDGERVLGASCGEGWAASMTSRRFLRFFSSGGNQGPVVWLKGEPVTMVGRGRFLAVVYHSSVPQTDGTQHLEYTLWDAPAFRVITQGSVSCLSKGSSVAWIGFSNDLSLLVMDSDGMLSMLTSTGEHSSPDLRMYEWVPVLDTIGLRKSLDDRHWPVTVYDGKLVCVPLKGGNTYPDATRRPVTTTLGLRMPLAMSVVTRNSTLEELSVRSNLALAQKKLLVDMEESGDHVDLDKEYLTLSAQVDKVTLKLFAATVDAGKLEAALDLVDRLHLEKSYDLAIRLADRHDKLADMIEDAKDRKFGIAEGDLGGGGGDNYKDYDDDDEPDNGYEGNPKGPKRTNFLNRLESQALPHITPDTSHQVQKRSMGRQQVSNVPKRHRLL